MAAADICIYDNENLFRSVTYTADGDPVDLTDGTFEMQIRRGQDGDLISTLSTANGRIVITDAVNGLFDISMTPADVQSEIGEGSFCYDIVFTSSGGIAKRLFGGDVQVLKGTTQ